MTTYKVTVTRDENLWAVVVDGLPAGAIGATDVERFEDLDIEVRDLIAGLTGTEPDSFGLTWRYIVDGQEVTDVIIRLTQAQAAFGDAARARDGARKAALAALAKAGLPQSAIGDVLGVSHQRVHQLLKAG